MGADNQTPATPTQPLARKAVSPGFYIQDDEEDDELPPPPPVFVVTSKINLPKRRSFHGFEKKSRPEPIVKPLQRQQKVSQSNKSGHPLRNSSVEASVSPKEPFSNLNDILKFPIESSHAYSYAQLSPNSLALRLNVLKRSLKILKDRPGLFKSLSINRDHDHDDTHSIDSLTSEYNAPLKNPRSNVFSNYQEIERSISHGSERIPSLGQNRSSLIYKNPLASNSGDFAYSPSNDSNFKLQANASMAALAAFFRPTMKRSDSLPINQLYSQKIPSGSSINIPETPDPVASTKTSLKASVSVNPNDPIMSEDLKDIISLLEDDELTANNSEIASTLHDLSLSSNKETLQLKQDFLKNKLLHALATPFVETSVTTSSLLGATSAPTSSSITPVTSNAPGIPYTMSSMALSSLTTNTLNPPVPVNPGSSTLSSGSGTANSRPFHSISLGKHALPQSVFTVETETPWALKAANDLACLMFGVLKNTIKNLTLMDLIAPQFRNFVTDRLLGMMSMNGSLFRSKDQERNASNNIIFAGEIVAISRPGDKQYAWTSMWAKKRGNLLIIMFDQIPCDAFDVVILCNKDDYPDQGYKIDSINEIAGKLIGKSNISLLKKISDLSDSIDQDLREDDDTIQHDNDLIDYYISQDVTDSEKINKTRYYTIHLKSSTENIPCAVTSNPIEINDDKYEFKLKIHALPYIAGIFVIRSLDYKILSCNNAIAKNLFGRSFDLLIDSSIDAIIPDFSKILGVGLEYNAGRISVVPGLVLPEHFFRKYDAMIRFEDEDAENEDIDEFPTEEELFLSSHGIKGLHRDGKTVYIDVQLRVSANDTFVLWVTYSRQSSKNNNSITKELDKLTSSASSLSLTTGDKSPASSRRTRENSSETVPNNVNLPSQLKLFQDQESEVLETGYHSNEVSRANSTRIPKANTFAIPVSRLNESLSNAIDAQRFLSDSSPSRQNSSSSSDSPSTSANNSALDTIDTSISEVSNSARSSKEKESEIKTETRTLPIVEEVGAPGSKIIPYKKYSEEEILKLENDQLAETIKKSSHWPTKIGTKKRTKKFSEFKVLKEMGEGAYGKVVLAQHREDPLYKIIIKCIDKERILVDTWVRDRRLGTIPSEIQIMAFLNNEPHVNIMRIIDYFEDPKYYYLETPIFGNPPAIDLFDFIELKKDMTELECQFIFKQITLAIYHLHKNGIVHRDIKDENVIVDEHGIIKLIDFGSAGYTKLGPFDVFVGTIDYASPEVLKGEKYEGKAQDIWALGILLYTLLYKENPFYNVDAIMEGELNVPYVISEASLNLIKRMLVREVEERPTITDIVEDTWLNF